MVPNREVLLGAVVLEEEVPWVHPATAALAADSTHRTDLPAKVKFDYLSHNSIAPSYFYVNTK